MNGIYLNKDESRTVARALQLLERNVTEKLEEALLPTEPPEIPLSPSVRTLLDQHDAISTLTVMLSNIGDHWVNKHGLELAQAGLHRYIDLLKTSIAENHVPEQEFLIDHDLRLCRVELARSAKLLERLEPNGSNVESAISSGLP